MKTVNDSHLISNEEDIAAKALRDRNLDNKNKTAEQVHPKYSFYTRYGKRIFDIIISFPACIILIPVNLILALITFFDVGNPIFFKQIRIGKDGKPFTMVKFRNMNQNTDYEGKLLPPEQRVTVFGKIIRKLSLDELLNFWLILKGDMSVIGPRPQPEFIYNRMCERHKMRAVVRPGLECPRVIHVYGENICKYQRTYENDVWYVENVGLLLDIKLFFMLIKMTFDFKRRGKQASGEGISYFVGYDENGIAISMNVYRRMQKEKCGK